MRHKHNWVRLTHTETLVQCVDCGKTAKQGRTKHKHVFGPWREKYPGQLDRGEFQVRECACGGRDTTKIASKWYPLSWKIHLWS